MPRHYALAIVIMAGFSGLRWNDARADVPQVYEVYAVRYAVLRGCPVSVLVEGADPQRKIDLAMMFWVLKAANGRIILVDAGFYRPKTVQSYGPADFEQPGRALARLSIDPEQVTDLVITHMHSDHAEGAALDKHVPIAATLDAKANLGAQDRMRQLAAKPGMIIPGHDPAVFVKFPKPGNGVARLD